MMEPFSWCDIFHIISSSHRPQLNILRSLACIVLVNLTVISKLIQPACLRILVCSQLANCWAQSKQYMPKVSAHLRYNIMYNHTNNGRIKYDHHIKLNIQTIIDLIVMELQLLCAICNFFVITIRQRIGNQLASYRVHAVSYCKMACMLLTFQ